uniref:Cilia- and flagella-associated protein 263 n=1 Tax=Clastoptera arizonana TaxID=38151 RepID=A0A1B6DVC6_9HEMI
MSSVVSDNLLIGFDQRDTIIEDLSKEALEANISQIKCQIDLLKAENQFFQDFLVKNDYGSLKGMDVFIELISKNPAYAYRSTSIFSSSTNITFSRRNTLRSGSTIGSTVPTKVPVIGDIGLEINILVLIELLDIELEDRRLSLNVIKREYNKSKFNFEAKKECRKLMLAEILEYQKQFDLFVTNKSKVNSSELHADNFIRFIEKYLQKWELLIRKFKLKMTAFKRENRRLECQLQQKLELMERLHPIDIEKLQIENKELLKVLNEKIRVLHHAKQTAGRIGQGLVMTKSNINKQTVTLKGITKDIDTKNTKFNKLEHEKSQEKNYLRKALEDNKNMRMLVQMYRAPEILDYVREKVESAEINNTVKIWNRRCENQKLTQSLITHNLRQLAGEEKKSSRFTGNILPFRVRNFESSDENFSTCAIASK